MLMHQFIGLAMMWVAALVWGFILVTKLTKKWDHEYAAMAFCLYVLLVGLLVYWIH